MHDWTQILILPKPTWVHSGPADNSRHRGVIMLRFLFLLESHGPETPQTFCSLQRVSCKEMTCQDLLIEHTDVATGPHWTALFASPHFP